MKNLRKIRKAKGLTMKQLGEAVGVSESTIGMIETEKRKPSYEIMLRLAEELECTVDDLVADKEIPTTESDGQSDLISDKDMRFLNWFRSLSPEKQRAILISQDAPEDIL